MAYQPEPIPVVPSPTPPNATAPIPDREEKKGKKSPAFTIRIVSHIPG
jgi:hypothetical protein